MISPGESRTVLASPLLLPRSATALLWLFLTRCIRLPTGRPASLWNPLPAPSCSRALSGRASLPSCPWDEGGNRWFLSSVTSASEVGQGASLVPPCYAHQVVQWPNSLPFWDASVVSLYSPPVHVEAPPRTCLSTLSHRQVQTQPSMSPSIWACSVSHCRQSSGRWFSWFPIGY